MTAVDTMIRSVLDAPHGARFTRTSAPAPRRVVMAPETFSEREQRLLRQMAGNPRVAHRLKNGAVPEWMAVDKDRREHAERKAREAERWETEPDDPFPPRKPRGRHRAPRWWRSDWAASTLTFGMALAAGMVVSHVTALLL
ncbi:hypothetical protein [Nocardiopsis valliformis]|uniref:hypothetical protein n=1 Tax=Nocardiopsis valliformis TaxID=239974 RepID=UPI00034AFB82|nr:hypothetical protein [Nocardiopsis valliformis]